MFAIFFTAWSNATLRVHSSEEIIESIDNAVSALSKHTPAQPGDRTVIDALIPFCVRLKEGGGLTSAAQAAREGANKTEGMKAKLGRATYVTGSDAGLPVDPGALGVAIVIEGFVQGFLV